MRHDRSPLSMPLRRARWTGWLTPLAIAALASVLLLVLTSEATFEQEHLPMETRWVVALYAWRSAGLTHAMLGVHRVHDLAIVGLFAIGLTVTIYQRAWRQLALLMAMVPGGMLLNLLVKGVIHRPRPQLAALVTTHGFSFPSDHAVGISVLSVWTLLAVWSATRSTAWRGATVLVAAVMTLTVAFSRVYLGAHYPSDVLASVLEAIAWCALCMAAANRWLPLNSLDTRPAGWRVLGAS